MALNESGVSKVTEITICAFIAIIAVVLRFWCKISMKSGIHADDWWILVTLISYMGALSTQLWGFFAGGEGKDIAEITAELKKSPSPEKVLEIENYLEALFLGNTIAYFVLFAAKISICLFYRRIFSVRQYRIQSIILIGISTMWLIGAFVANFCICIPVDLFWHRMKPGRCLNFNQFYLSTGIIETFIDALILALPIRAVFQVQLPLKTKFVVSGIFLLGGFTVITNILRIYYGYQPNAYYVSFKLAELWLVIHIAVAILCACLPVYKPLRALANQLLVRIRDRYYSLRFSGSSSKLRHGDSSHDGTGISHDLDTLKRNSPGKLYVQNSHQSQESANILIPPGVTSVTTIERNEEMPGAVSLPFHGIVQTRKVDVV
ncbi:hypothetical protein F5Y04DRAFT_292308 [Hypomontagnella monticulosa]|nr:hypothetical protein F5Y04DRAFT_292308 [Hypomontagnella monticulosa]